MIVRTIAMPNKEPKMEIAKREIPKSAPTTVKAKPAKKTTPSLAKTKSVVKAKAPENRLFNEITQSLEALSKEAKLSRSNLNLPPMIKAKAQIVSESKSDPTYGEYLVAYLQNALDLPEYGEVKAKIEIDRFGQLTNFEILEAKSMKNGEFLKNRLKELTFPCLNDETQSFTITFRNVEVH